MTPEKRKKCRDLSVKLRNSRLKLQGTLRKMNSKNQEAITLRNEIDALESQVGNIARSTSLNAIGLGDKKGRPLSIGGLAMDSIDAVKLASKIKQKISELSFVIQDQKRHQENSEKDERVIESLQHRIDRMGCR